MDRPRMKCEMAIGYSIKEQRFISVHATRDAAAQLEGFGTIYNDGNGKYSLTVDPRYDFDEVMAWISSYGKDGVPFSGIDVTATS